MAPWHEVSDLKQLNQFLDVVNGFHDGVLKEIHWVNGDHVSESLSLLPCRLSNARMLVQRQANQPSAVEIYFQNIWSITLDTVDFIFESTAEHESPKTLLDKQLHLLRLNLEGSRIVFERLYWRDASDFMGYDVRFGPFTAPLPVSNT